MKHTDEQHQGTFQDTERSPTRNLTINHLPGEVLLGIFDLYRQDIDPNNNHWRGKYLWFNLTHVCRKWRAVMFASSSRLDLGIIVRPNKPGDIESVLSSPLPILFVYRRMYGNVTGSILWRMRAALEHHHDRVREIAFEGTAKDFDEFFKILRRTEGPRYFPWRTTSVKPASTVSYVVHRSFTSISGLLSSRYSLTDLFLSTEIDTTVSLSVTPLLACLQGMPCLRSLHLILFSDPLDSRSQPPSPRDIVPLSKLKYFYYDGRSALLNALLAGLSASFLRDVCFRFRDEISSPIVHVPRFIDEIDEHYHAVKVDFLQNNLRLLFLTQSEYIRPCFGLGIEVRYNPESIMRMSGALSTRLTTVEELKITTAFAVHIQWCRFYQMFPSVKVLRTEGEAAYWLARTFRQDHGEPDYLSFLPALEEIDLGKNLWDQYQVAAFEPFVSARQQAGRPVKVVFGP